MKNTFLKKKIFILFLTALMLLSAGFVCDVNRENRLTYASLEETDYETLSQEDSFDFEYGDGGYYVAKFKGNQSNVEIPDYYNGEKVLGIKDADYNGKGVFEGNKKIISVKMGKNSVFVGRRAFYGCENLEDFDFCADTEYVGRYAFYGCTSLYKIDLPSTVTYVGCYAFINSGWYENAINEAKEKYDENPLCIYINHVLLDVVYANDGELSSVKEGTTVFAEYALLNGDRKVVTKLKKVVIPSSVKYLNGYCFGLNGYKVQDEVSILKIEGDVVVGENAFGTISNSLNEKNSVKFGYENGVQYVGSRATSFNATITKDVTVKEGVTEISDGAFAIVRTVKGDYETDYRDNTQIESVVIPASVKRIGKNAFIQCVNLKKVTFLGEKLTIEAGAFKSCKNLVEFVGIDKVKSVGRSAFSGCEKLENATFSGCEIGVEAFKNCNSLEITLNGNCTVKKDAFVGCDKVPACVVNADNERYYLRQEQNQTTLDVPSAKKVYVAEFAFENSEITAVNVQAEQIILEKGAFAFCRELVSVSLNKSVPLARLLFYGDEKLSSINFTPLGVGEFALANTSVTSVDFSNAEYFSDFALTDSKISSVNVSGVKEEGVSSSAFFGAKFLSEIVGVNGYYAVEDGVLYGADETEVLCYPANKSGTLNLPSTVTKIGDYSFAFVNFGEQLLRLGVNHVGKQAFYHAKASGVKMLSSAPTIEEKAFYGAEIDEFAFGEENESKSGIIRYKAFAYSTLTSADLSEASLDTMVFKGCASLKKVSFAFKNDLYCNFGYLFGNDYFDGSTPCLQSKTNEKRATYYIPAVEEVVVKGDKIGLGAFMSTVSLKKVVISNGIEKIGDKAFVSCGALEEVVISSSVKNVGSQAFNSCKRLQSVVLPSDVTLGSSAFAYCENLGEVTLRGDAFFGNGVFSACKNLKTVRLAQYLSVSDNAYGLLFENCETVTVNGVEVDETQINEWKQLSVEGKKNSLNKTQKISLAAFILAVVCLIAYLVWAFAFRKKEREYKLGYHRKSFHGKSHSNGRKRK